MRITGGYLKGRTFYPPAGKWPTRPTTDIAREALFNVLSNFLDYEHINALDLFGGSGAHSYELISRGCKSVSYVDHFKPCHIFVRKMLKSFDIESCVELFLMDYLIYLKSKSGSYDYIFAGPPYPLQEIPLIPDQVFESSMLKPSGIFTLEHNPDHKFDTHPKFWKSKNYGQTFFSFFKG